MGGFPAPAGCSRVEAPRFRSTLVTFRSLSLSLLLLSSFGAAASEPPVAQSADQAPPAAAQPAADAPAQPAVAEADPDERVCRRERTIGSNRPTMVCRTRAQAERERERAREAAASHSRN